MIEVTIAEARDAMRAFVGSPWSEGGIANTKVPAKAAYRVARIVQKLRAVTIAFEEKQRRIFREAGAHLAAGQLVLEMPPRREDETDAEFQARQDAHQTNVRDVSERIEAMLAEVVTIDCDPVPIDLFGDAPLAPADCALADKFLKE